MTRSGSRDSDTNGSEFVAELDAVVWEADVSPLRFTFISPHAQDAFGYPVTYWFLRSNFWAHHIYPSDKKRVLAALRQAARKGKSVPIQYRFLAVGKRVLWLSDRVRLSKSADGKPKLRGAMIDISALKQTEERLRSSESLYRSLYRATLDLEDESRQHIARQLYESTSQQLAALKIHLGVIRASSMELSPKAGRALRECLVLADECCQEIRSLSHALHPPMMEEFGLESGLRSYLASLSQRSGIRLRAVVDPRLRHWRLSKTKATAIFRIIQEALPYVWIHSAGATGVLVVSIRPAAKQLVLQITTDGHSPSARTFTQKNKDAATLDVGLAAIEERVGQLGGTFRLRSGKRRNVLTVALSLSQKLSR